MVKVTKKLTKKSRILYILGVILVGTSIGWNLNQTIQNIQLSFITPKVTQIKNNSSAPGYSIPTEINIDKVNLHLPVEETVIYNGIWQIAQRGASHLAISARPGEKGPIIFYAHNTNDKFGPIRWLSIGDVIQIKTGNGKNHKYIISQAMQVQPSELNIFTNIKEESLILYTCDGFADLKRFVLIGKPD